MSHEEHLYDQRNEDGAAKKWLHTIERVTGYAPPTCPWRAMYDPLVMEVMSVMALDENGNLGVALGADPPAILVEGIAAYKHALAATRAEEAKLRAEEAKRDREARQ